MKKIEKKKIFVTGLSGNGKTWFATQYAKEFNHPYISFDENWDYSISRTQPKIVFDNVIQKYGDSFITDAIPFPTVDGKALFLDYYNENKDDIKVICVVCPNLNELHKRRLENPSIGSEHKELWNVYYDLYDFYGKTLKSFKSLPNVDIEYYDTFSNEYISGSELYGRVRQELINNFKGFLESLAYDKNYQAIECINFPGYTDSIQTWNNIKDLVDWKGKKVADLGCFHGYFGFKAAKAGAIVTGLDLHPVIIKTASVLNYIEGNIVNFKQWEGGQEVSADYDIVLALNVIHHFKDLRTSLQNIKARTVIFEVNQEEIEPITEFFTIIKKVKSHRHSIKHVDRSILLCVRK